MVSYIDGMLRYFEFWGRSSRMQYFLFFLFLFVLVGLGIAIDYQVQGRVSPQLTRMPVTLFMMLIHIVPSITVQVRRLHDIGKSGGWYLLNFVPLGGLVLLYWACRPSLDGMAAPEPLFVRSARAVSTIPAGVRMGKPANVAEMVEGRFI